MSFPTNPATGAEGYEQVDANAAGTAKFAGAYNESGGVVANTDDTIVVFYKQTGEDFSGSEVGIPLKPLEKMYCENKDAVANLRFKAATGTPTVAVQYMK